MAEPMSDERLAEIRIIAAHEHAAGTMVHAVTQHLTTAVRELLAEVERLRGAACALNHDWAEHAVELVTALTSPMRCQKDRFGNCDVHAKTIPDDGDCPHALAKAWLSGAHAHLRTGGGGQ